MESPTIIFDLVANRVLKTGTGDPEAERKQQEINAAQQAQASPGRRGP